MQCKCHGMSGSCEVRTCWKAAPDFRRVGDFLKKKYNKAQATNISVNRVRRKVMRPDRRLVLCYCLNYNKHIVIINRYMRPDRRLVLCTCLNYNRPIVIITRYIRLDRRLGLCYCLYYNRPWTSILVD